MTVQLPPSLVASLRAAFRAADYTVGGVDDLLGPEAHRALGRNETTPARRRTTDGSALSTLTRLWPLQATVTIEAAELSLPGMVDALTEAGVVDRSVDEIRARIDIRPYAEDDKDWWVVSDLAPGLDGAERRMRPDHVLGVSSASRSLAQLTVRTPVRSALDIGTGSGVQALHLSRHADSVVATDLNPRCLAMAALTAELNEVSLDLRQGSLFEPVVGERFDLIVTNPPFVVSSGTGEQLTYRDSGLRGDEVVRRIVSECADRLEDGGWCQLLANWVHRRGEPWTDRLGSWLTSTGCDAWVVQREVTEPSQYVELWLNDAGLRGAADYRERYDAWLTWFEDQRIEAVGFGWLSLHKAGRSMPNLVIEDWPFEIEQPLGPHVSGWAARVGQLHHLDDATLLSTHLLRAPDVVEERVGIPGDEHLSHIVLRQQRGMRRARRVTTAVAAMVGACDGDLSLANISDALATLLVAAPPVMREELTLAARSLIEEGFLSFR